jgi:hypothetical protein
MELPPLPLPQLGDRRFRARYKGLFGTFSSAPTIVREHGVVLRKQGCKLRGGTVLAIAKDTVHDDQRRAGSPLRIGDGRSIARSRRPILTH